MLKIQYIEGPNSDLTEEKLYDIIEHDNYNFIQLNDEGQIINEIHKVFLNQEKYKGLVLNLRSFYNSVAIRDALAAFKEFPIILIRDLQQVNEIKKLGNINPYLNDPFTSLVNKYFSIFTSNNIEDIYKLSYYFFLVLD